MQVWKVLALPLCPMPNFHFSLVLFVLDFSKFHHKFLVLPLFWLYFSDQNAVCGYDICQVSSINYKDQSTFKLITRNKYIWDLAMHTYTIQVCHEATMSFNWKFLTFATPLELHVQCHQIIPLEIRWILFSSSFEFLSNFLIIEPL